VDGNVIYFFIFVRFRVILKQQSLFKKFNAILLRSGTKAEITTYGK
jgi:hypothetical protein